MVERYTSQKIPFSTILRWQFTKYLSPRSEDKHNLFVQTHDSLPDGDYAMWMGHASLWLSLAGTTLTIDPVFGDIPMHKRHTPLPVPVNTLHAQIILITHAHYDHFDRSSVRMLLKHNPEAVIVAPIGFWRYLNKEIERERCLELEWWESVMIGGLFITLTPARHWSKRTPFDTNKALWGGYVIQSKEHCLYHSGDTAQGGHFKEIAERFEIDEAFLPIGAYRPEWIMRHNHLNPQEAIDAAIDLKAKSLIPIHYGTFSLSDEPLHEPKAWFEHRIETNPPPFRAKLLEIGEIYRFNDKSTFTST
ncbi:MAG: MBL fold metallo-hydrolase [Sulfuricurvum sp.]|jgi:L-ascorbate metabolism protein UlaG (beta-lactamase superfamily)|uniref:MBL fold metallo-hydrolase n=1 Tax=Sulfuricurvum sp. TaxID=2025608 RepID=UPI0025CCF6BC|nr:MBL fold metallo-hydrolase [Sulfuricurvum sp.]MCK9371570.1 MBL fold metallo-hydrolase [Sulfuricurvum sp.]